MKQSLYDIFDHFTPEDNTLPHLKEQPMNEKAISDQVFSKIGYHPIVKEPVNQGSFKKNIYWMLEYEGSSTKIFCSESFNANNDEQIKNLTSYISSIIDQRNTKLTNIYLNILDEEIANK